MQQFSFIDLFIDLFESAVHFFGQQTRPSSGALLTVYTSVSQPQGHGPVPGRKRFSWN